MKNCIKFVVQLLLFVVGDKLFDCVLVIADSTKQNASKHQHEWFWWLLAYCHCR